MPFVPEAFVAFVNLRKSDSQELSRQMIVAVYKMGTHHKIKSIRIGATTVFSHSRISIW